MSSVPTPVRSAVPFLDLRTPHRELGAEILAVWQRILEEAAFVGGVEVERFEEEFARYIGTACCVGTGTGTDALRLALLAAGIGAGDEVITSPMTFIATTEAISQTGARPVFADIEEHTATLDPASVERVLTPRTRALVPVHLYGQPADMAPLLEIAKQHDLRVIEDACQAHGAGYRGQRAGSLADAAAFSFYPGKNLGACGEAGAVTTNDADLAARVRSLRDHGQSRKYEHTTEGYNARLDALQAATLRIKLPHLEAWNTARRRWATRYTDKLATASVRLPVEANGRHHVWHLFVVRSAARDHVRTHLADAGVASGLHYPQPLHLQPAYAHLGHSAGDFPVSESWAAEGLSLPLFPHMTAGQVDDICARLLSLPG